MTEEDKRKLSKRWFNVTRIFEDKIEDLFAIGMETGLIILVFPICFILKTIQWLSYVIGVWIIKLIPTRD